jgi:hypothetical protein
MNWKYTAGPFIIFILQIHNIVKRKSKQLLSKNRRMLIWQVYFLHLLCQNYFVYLCWAELNFVISKNLRPKLMK